MSRHKNGNYNQNNNNKKQIMVRAILIFTFFLNGCVGQGQKKETPKEFLNNVVVDAVFYLKDSAALLDDLRSKMINHKESFSNPEYFDSTILIIDTIMYDSSLSKLAIFWIAKNPTSRNPYSNSKLAFYYNAGCYLAKRKTAGYQLFELKPLGPFSLANFENEETGSIKKAIRDYYFLELATVLDENSRPVFQYNLNDKRFWDSPTGWGRMFE